MEFVAFFVKPASMRIRSTITVTSAPSAVFPRPSVLYIIGDNVIGSGTNALAKDMTKEPSFKS